ncbi:unnamed protein product [Phytophthora fragariaefolia]|uniref:Unnamed protein product n=1 Tax=Phytophthora fragariaefolia TaxID=1490495 RepID=A0A9W7CXR6_9STRA|nr:unnamed protein product [Phytophthora fragariaefolia]
MTTSPDAHAAASADVVPCRCETPVDPGGCRVAPTPAATSRYTANAASRAGLWDAIRRQGIEVAQVQVELRLPVPTPTSIAESPTLNKALQHVLFEFVRRTHISLQHFVGLMRGQTAVDYRPNKHMLPNVLRLACRGYRHLDALLDIATSVVQAPLTHSLPPKQSYPANHKSALDLLPAGLCVNKTFTRTPTSSCKLGTWRLPFAMLAPRVGVRICLADDQRQTTLSSSTHRLLSVAPASYDVVGGAIAYLHGRSVNVARDAGPFNYVWVDGHINVDADIGSNCADVEQSLRLAMATVLGHDAINDTSWVPRQQILGLMFDTVTNTVAMPASKIARARKFVGHGERSISAVQTIAHF